MYKTTLEIEGREYNLSSININTYNRGSDYEPNINDQTIQLQFKTARVDDFIWDWATSDDIKKKDGTLKIVDTEEDETVQTVEFKAGFCTGYNLSFHANNDYNNETSVTLAAAKVSVLSSRTTMQPGSKKDD